MMHTLIARTGEVDDIDAAIDEIRGQIDFDTQLLKNTVGIIACHYEFVESGMAKEVCSALPFEVVGTISPAQAVPVESGTMLFTLMVLTSDDVVFHVELTDPLHGDCGTIIEQAYKNATADITARPALLFVFGSFMIENSGDNYVNAITRVSGGVPCFGTLSVDDSADFEHCYLIKDGEFYANRLAMLMIYGDLSPKFYIATISENKVLDKPALITSSDGHILKEVNGRPVVEYFEDLGLTKASETMYAMSSLPFMLDYGDGTPPVSKVFIGLSDEKSAICAGYMPEGATLKIGVFDKDDVLRTTGDAIQKMMSELESASGVLIYSCIARNMSLGADQLAEADLIRELLGKNIGFMMAYSGGEFCPTQLSDDIAINRFHNNSIVICAF